GAQFSARARHPPSPSPDATGQSMIQRKAPLAFGTGGAVVPGDEQVRHGQHVEGEQGADGHAEGDHEAEGEARHRSGAGGDEQRHHGHHQGGGGHQHRTQAHGGGVLDGLALAVALLLKAIGELDDKDAVLGDHPDQGDEAHLGVDVDGGAGHLEEGEHIEPEERAADGHGDGDQHDDRIPPGLELGSKHQVDQQQREKEDTDQIRGFVLVLPRLAAVIHAVPGGEDIAGGVLQYPEYFPEGHPGPRHAADGDAVDLLKMVQALGLHGILEGHHRADGHQFAAGGAGVVVVELIGGQAIDPLDLRNHLVGAVVDGKAVDLAAGEQARQVGGQLGHVDADLRGFLPVDENVGDGFVDLHVGVHKDELPALPGADQDLVRQFLENLRGRGAADDEFHRHPHAAGGQGWARHHGDLQAGDLAHLGNDVLVDDLHGAAAALAPGGEDEGAKGAV